MRSDADGYARTYVLGHSDHELARLEKQAEIFAEATEDILRRAGIVDGMRVLDIGCGVGDVSLIAARLVGPTGSVLGLDRAPEALGVARRRADARGYHWLRFDAGDFDVVGIEGTFDALIGRFILMYLTDPGKTLRRLTPNLEPGGIVAFVEMDMEAAGAVPEMPLLAQSIDWITATYRRAGAEPNMGSRLHGTFRNAGLTPKMMGSNRIEAGPDSVAYELAAGTLRSLFPQTQELGVATPEEVGIDTLAERLRRDALAGDHCILLPRVVGAWARTAES